MYESLRDMIVRGRISPGMRITENEVAERFGVSRTPARQALQRLHQDGFVRQVSNGRRTEVAVAPLTRSEAIDVYTAMGVLEGAAARLIAKLPVNERAQTASVLKHAQQKFETLARKRPPPFDRMFDAHNQFHALLVQGHTGPHLNALIESLRPHVERYEWVYAPVVGPGFGETFDEHNAILHAVEKGTAKAIENSVRANWDKSAERLLAALDASGEKGVWVTT